MAPIERNIVQSMKLFFPFWGIARDLLWDNKTAMLREIISQTINTLGDVQMRPRVVPQGLMRMMLRAYRMV
jgi:hypothetical protein